MKYPDGRVEIDKVHVKGKTEKVTIYSIEDNK